MPARLIVHFSDQPAASFIAQEGHDYVLGRDEGCEFRLEDDRVSRQHARLSGAGAGWALTDLESKNGTSVNWTPIRAVDLTEACWLSLGGLIVRFEPISESQRWADSEASLRRWQSSFELQRSIDPALGLERMLQRVLESVRALSGAERGFVMLADAAGELQVVATAGLEPQQLWEREFSGSIGAIERALAKGAPMAVSDLRAETLGQRPSVIERGIRALVCLPLKTLDRTIGILYADSLRPGASFGQLDVEILDALAAHAALAIGVASLDQNLKGLAASVANLPGIPQSIAAEIEREIQRVRQRAFAAPGGPDRGPAAGSQTLAAATWSELRVHHGARAAERA